MVHVNSQKDDVLALNEISNVQHVYSLRRSLLEDPRNTFRFVKFEEKSFGILWGMSKPVYFESFYVISPTNNATFDHHFRAFHRKVTDLGQNQWRSQNAEKVTHIKGRLLYQTMTLYKYIPF